MDPVKAAADVTVLLATYGPWALVSLTIIIAFAVVRWLTTRMTAQIADLNAQLDLKDKMIERKDEQLLQLVERRHVEFTQMLGEMAGALTTASDVNKRMIASVDRCERRTSGN